MDKSVRLFAFDFTNGLDSVGQLSPGTLEVPAFPSIKELWPSG